MAFFRIIYNEIKHLNAAHDVYVKTDHLSFYIQFDTCIFVKPSSFERQLEQNIYI
jgi:hypothetical protein